jgi:tetratricopeptide (TPR) repeat protein
MLKLVKIVLIGVVLSAGIIGAVVLMTPLTIEEVPRIDPSASIDPSGSDVEVARPDLVSDNRQVTLQLPTVRLVKGTKELQDELRETAKAVTEAFPKDSASWHLAAQIESELSQSERAEFFWRKCLELKPLHFGPYLGLAELLTSKGRFQDATQVLQRVFELGGSTEEVYLKLGEAFENQGKLKEALDTLTIGVELFPQDSSLLYGLGRLQAQSERLSEAENNIKRAMALGGENKKNLSTLVGVLMRLDKRDEALNVRERLKEMSAQDHASSGQGESAFQVAYDAALSTSAYRIFEGCGNLAYQNRQFSMAEKYLLRAIGQDPKIASGWITLSEVLLHQSKYGDVIEVLQRIIELEPKDLVYRVNLASVGHKLGDTQLAESTLRQAIEIDPNSELVLAALAKLHAATGNFAKAKEAVALLVKLNSSPEVLQLKEYIEKAASQAVVDPP